MYHKQFHLRGIHYNSRKDPSVERQKLIHKIKSKDRLTLEEYTYEGKPAIMVINPKDNLDIGVVPAEDTQKILPHMNEPYNVWIIEIYDFDDNPDNRGMKLQFCTLDEEVPTEDLKTEKPKPSKPFYARWWFILIVGIFVFNIIIKIFENL